ncbi:MAG: TatD family hydrolase [Kiritimatiellae bacterium]|nr:TatD family hydrolase [Kiritimatiellia bacterium]
MPLWYDTHAHLDDFAAAGTLDAVLARAAAAGVTRVCAMGGSPDANRLAVRLATDRPETLVAAVGYDRDLAAASPDPAELRDLAQSPAVRAIGEIGLDYYYDPDGAAAQRALFDKMLALALDLRLPVCVHSRDADSDTLAALREFSNHWKKTFQSLEKSVPPGILHCYTRGPEMAEELLDLGFCISFSGILSFNNAGPLREVASRIPLDRLLVETDSPYLAPKPHRGKTCEPMYTARTGEVLAECTGIPPDTLADATTANAHRVYGGPFRP